MSRRIVILAGRGALAPEVASAASAAGDAAMAIAFDPAVPPLNIPTEQGSIADLPGLFARIKAFGATHVVLAGAVDLPDAQRRALAQGLGGTGTETADVPLSRLGMALVSATGANLAAIPDVAPALAAGTGLLAGPPLVEGGEARAMAALVVARQVGAIDLGQSVILAGTRPIAAEDIGGTDALLARVADLRLRGLICGGLTLGKAMKPHQPRFVDLPVIGPGTIRAAQGAGIDLIAVEAGNTLILRREETASAAEVAGISLWGARV